MFRPLYGRLARILNVLPEHNRLTAVVTPRKMYPFDRFYHRLKRLLKSEKSQAVKIITLMHVE